jgi:hypothetical protein
MFLIIIEGTDQTRQCDDSSHGFFPLGQLNPEIGSPQEFHERISQYNDKQNNKFN